VGPGGIEYLVAGDGYGAVLESLEHYIRRLRAMGEDPANSAGMFGAVIRQAAIKRHPAARRTRQSLLDFLAGGVVPTEDEMQIMKSALECYESDIRQAAGGSQYHAGLLDGDAVSEAKVRAVSEARAAICGPA
jgi:hypothetical protein